MYKDPPGADSTKMNERDKPLPKAKKRKQRIIFGVLRSLSFIATLSFNIKHVPGCRRVINNDYITLQAPS